MYGIRRGSHCPPDLLYAVSSTYDIAIPVCYVWSLSICACCFRYSTQRRSWEMP